MACRLLLSLLVLTAIAKSAASNALISDPVLRDEEAQLRSGEGTTEAPAGVSTDMEATPLASALHADEVQKSQQAALSASNATICLIVRTFWGHGDNWGDHSLANLLGALTRQTHNKWEALLLVLDNRPFPELRQLVKEHNDSRVWVYAEWIHYKYSPKTPDGSWAPQYHNRLYNLTDSAIRACPSDTEWVVVTNGDNDYDEQFMATVLQTPPLFDSVAFDFYSRYQRPTGNPCERFAALPGMPLCKENEMRFCQTDLAANAYRWQRLIAENRRFGTMDPGGSSAANDGMMAQTLLAEGWKVHHVRDRCMVNHAPSPQQCAAGKGVWDDTAMADPQHFGGSCITKEDAMAKIMRNPRDFEAVTVNVSYDPQSFDYGNGGDDLLLTCLRVNDKSKWQQQYVFGRVCCARVDYANLPPELPAHPWDAWQNRNVTATIQNMKVS